ncbi:FAD-binding domain-containing protein [Aspergillus keveii]|uniref:FAD-binding domain-containing protein n=1 Tax=Aspergillus keveii TaxID=714993 RepID=A0ABR4FV21_9EURO
MSIAAAIKALLAKFPSSQVLLRGTDEFTDRNKSYLSVLESDLTPAAIFQPKSTEEVSQFLQTVTPLKAPFAVRGAGQQPLPGCANIQDGITLDLGLLTGVEVKDNGSVSVGAGARWGSVYEALDGKRLGVTGSRSSKGGIGGLALSGGLSFFSSREGFISDNVLAYEIVLASGETITANSSENSDLWLALRGGGNNFGIVTRYELRTFPQPQPFWSGSIYYFQPSFGGQIDALVSELNKGGEASKETHLMLSVGYAAQFGQTMCQNQVYYTGKSEGGEEVPEVLKVFTDIQPKLDQISSVQQMSLKDAAAQQAAAAMDNQRCAYMNTTIKADAATLKAIVSIYTTALEPIKSIDGLVCSLTVQPYPLSLLQKSAELGGNSLGLSPESGPLVSLLLLAYWAKKDDDEKLLAAQKDTLSRIRDEAVKRNVHVPFEFLNYAFSQQDPIGSYGLESGERLRDVSRKYDPEGVFQKLVPGGFKLFT